MGDPGQNRIIATNVRSWLHYDTLASSLYKQSMCARKARDDFETKVIQDLRAQHNENALIQINSGIIRVVEERNPRPLTVNGLEQIVHLYFQQKGAGGRDDTIEIMNFIRRHRGYNTIKHLRKTGGVTAPPLPPPPGVSQICGGGGSGIGTGGGVGL